MVVRRIRARKRAIRDENARILNERLHAEFWQKTNKLRDAVTELKELRDFLVFYIMVDRL